MKSLADFKHRVVYNDMAWTTVAYSRSEVDRAGEKVASAFHEHTDFPIESWAIVSNWRASHSFPMNTFQNGLRVVARKVDKQPLIAQRLKRLSSIVAKLLTFSTMTLSQMQDIGGCRAVVADVARVRRLVELYKRKKTHRLQGIDDYITEPKYSGYRSVHLKYRYHSVRNETYNGLRVELQIRTRLQHAWATAVETVGAFTKQALKSSKGSDDWLLFFRLMGSAMAFREKSPLVPETPTNPDDLRTELQTVEKRLEATTHLTAYGNAMKTIEEHDMGDSHYYLLTLDATEKRVAIQGFGRHELSKASAAYDLAEQTTVEHRSSKDTVLVSVDSIKELKRAYPNYFADTHAFVEAVSVALGTSI